MDSNHNPFPLSGCFSKLVSRNYDDISKEVSQEKVKAAIFYMESWKASRSDENGFVISSKSLKEEGGLGIRREQETNQLFLMKLAWGLIYKRDSLWVQVMRAKYARGDIIIPKVHKKTSSSNTWIGITKLCLPITRGRAETSQTTTTIQDAAERKRLCSTPYAIAPTSEWLSTNLSLVFRKQYRTPWPIIFVTACNIAWKCRNDFIFRDETLPNNQLHQMIREIAENYSITLSITEHNGSIVHSGSRGACRGIIRDWAGRTIAGFTMNIEPCTITMAELWVFYVGIKLASELRITKLVVESDSRCAVTLVQKASPESHGSSSLVRSIKEFLVKMDNVEVKYIYLENNFLRGFSHEAGSRRSCWN
ncbi:hypothetical protein Ahy_A02g009627 [Arachis hypogaea]|uniref:RNase H type-1 domain-containing protein n=1 Tax=Arachis hypogaea TaxID=3818 RepID=A0A445EHK1_ARAHY|nr:hypothetical protein Ahy_A02g009627 [Arachis hypogaea]